VHYILDGKTPVKCHNSLTWSKWFETADLHVAQLSKGDVYVSTVFLGIDHNFSTGGPPILFETMIFGGEHDGKQWGYATWEEAENGHEEACRLVGIEQVIFKFNLTMKEK